MRNTVSLYVAQSQDFNWVTYNTAYNAQKLHMHVTKLEAILNECFCGGQLCG